MNTTAYRGVHGGPRDPNTQGGYCLAICRCGDCPQYAEQQQRAELLREQEYQTRVRVEGERWAKKQAKTRRENAA